MMYLIIRETYYKGIDNSYDVEDYTNDFDIATDKLRGYQLINTKKDTTYSILKYESPHIQKEVAWLKYEWTPS